MTQVKTEEEMRWAHKVLAFLATQYIFQDGFDIPADVSLTSMICLPISSIIALLFLDS